MSQCQCRYRFIWIMGLLPTRMWVYTNVLPDPRYLYMQKQTLANYTQHIVSRCSSSGTLCHHLTSNLPPVFRRVPVEETVGLRNHDSCDPIRESGDRVFGKRTSMTTGSDYVPNDDLFSDINNMADNTSAKNFTAIAL